jgi:hypothetical protein
VQLRVTAQLGGGTRCTHTEGLNSGVDSDGMQFRLEIHRREVGSRVESPSNICPNHGGKTVSRPVSRVDVMHCIQVDTDSQRTRLHEEAQEGVEHTGLDLLALFSTQQQPD